MMSTTRRVKRNRKGDVDLEGSDEEKEHKGESAAAEGSSVPRKVVDAIRKKVKVEENTVSLIESAGLKPAPNPPLQPPAIRPPPQPRRRTPPTLSQSNSPARTPPPQQQQQSQKQSMIDRARIENARNQLLAESNKKQQEIRKRLLGHVNCLCEKVDYLSTTNVESGVDLFGGFLTDDNLDFFDKDRDGAIVVPRTKPLFPEDFPGGVNNHSLSWWGVADRARGDGKFRAKSNAPDPRRRR